MKDGEHKIPFIYGESRHFALMPNETSRLSVPPGRWTLSPRSLVPYATINVPMLGGREVTWGTVVEIPQGSQGTVVNTSAHQGDVVLDAIGTGQGVYASPPGTISLPITWSLDATLTQYLSTRLDTRRARRAYLCLNQAVTILPAPLNILIVYFGDRRGVYLVPGGAAATAGGGFLAYGPTAIGYKSMIPLGLGSGANLDTGGNSLMETRPMALFDALQVRIAQADYEAQLNPPGSPTIDLYFMLEY